MSSFATHARVCGISAAILAVTSVALYGLFLLAGRNSAVVALVIGAIVGTEAGAVLYHRQNGVVNSIGLRAVLGASLAVASLAVSALMQLAASWLPKPGISIPVSAAGAFVLPFLLFNPMWNALKRGGGPGTK